MKIRKYWPLLVVLLIVLVLVAGKIISGSRNQNTNPPAEGTVILFYGDTCPHCQNVDDYLKENKVRERFSFQELEVYNNQKNAALLTKTAQTCGLDTSAGVGVPFLFDGQNCLVGDRDVINYFQNK